MNYVKLGVALGLSWVTMLILSMSMIREPSHFHLNLSNAWMALVMVAPMGLIMLGVMGGMYPNDHVKVIAASGLAVLFVAAFALGRGEAGVGDDQFLRSMIPHHSRAILVCQEADLADPRIIELCGRIVQTQREEIREMERYLDE